jgi:hypothetical protein
MATTQFTARRAIVALGIGAVIAAAPTAASAGVPGIVAQPGDCTTTSEPGEASLNCAPEVVPNVGAPGEMQLTDSNPGMDWMEHSGNH